MRQRQPARLIKRGTISPQVGESHPLVAPLKEVATLSGMESLRREVQARMAPLDEREARLRAKRVLGL